MTTAHSARSIGGVPVLETDRSGLIGMLRERLRERRPTELLFANANFVTQCHPLADRLRGPETLIVNDGIGVDLASWLVHRRFFRENLNGTDFVPRLLDSLEKRTRLFLLGARPDVVATVARRWAEDFEVVGAIDGFDGMRRPDAVLDAIRDARPDVLLLALGDPRQARWIIAHREHHGVPLVIAVGALFDFTAGVVRRAPAWVRACRLEWAYRFAQEPRRLLKRYSIDLLAFFAQCRRAHRAERRAAAGDARGTT